MPAPAPIDPLATPAAVALNALLWNLTNRTAGFTVGGLNTHLIAAALSGQDIAAGTPELEFDQFKLTTGKTPAWMQAAIDYGNDTLDIANYTPQGVVKCNAAAFLPTLIAHAQRGGLIGLQNSLRNIPTQYAAQGTLSAPGGLPTTIAAINALGSMTVPMSVGSMPVGGGNIKLTVQTATPSLVQGTYMNRVGNVLGGVVLQGAGATVVNNNAVVYLAQLLPSRANFMSGADSAGAWCLQYDATAYQKLPGAGANTLGGCSYTTGTNVTVTTTGNTRSVPITRGMVITGLPGMSAATVGSVPSATTFTIIGTVVGGPFSAQTATFTLGTAADFAAAQLVDANANLCAMLDQLTPVFAELQNLGIALVFRHLNEANLSGGNWFHFAGAGNCYWWPYLFVFAYGYWTGQQIFAGQPVSPNPVHNLLFVHAPYADTAAGVVVLPPIVGGVMYADGPGIDQYANPPNSYATDYIALKALWTPSTPWGGFCEVFGGNNGTPANVFPNGYTDEATYGGAPVDLSTLGGGDLVLTAAPDIASYFAQSSQSFAAAGTAYVPTTKGLQAVTYASLVGGPAAPVTLHNLTVTGVPVGAFIIPKANVNQPVSIAANNCGTATFLTDVKASNAWEMTWWGNLCQALGADLAGATTIMTDPNMITLENLPTYFVAPWKSTGAMFLG